MVAAYIALNDCIVIAFYHNLYSADKNGSVLKGLTDRCIFIVYSQVYFYCNFLIVSDIVICSMIISNIVKCSMIISVIVIYSPFFCEMLNDYWRYCDILSDYL